MKILLTSEFYKPTINGLVTSMVNLKQGLEARGHEVRVATLGRFPHYDKDLAAYYFPSLSLSYFYPDARLSAPVPTPLYRELLEWGPDLVHSQGEGSSFLIAKRISKARSIPVVHTYHTDYEYYTHYFAPNETIGKNVIRSLSKRELNSIDAVIAPTKKIARLLNSYEVETPTYVVPTGIDFSKFDNLKEKAELRQDLNLPQDRFIVLFLGRLGKEKNISEILRYLADFDLDPLFLLVGDGSYRDHLEKEVQELGLEHQVIFTGMVEPDQVSSYYRSSDLFVSASESETQGLTYIEAQACGLPILCKKDASLDDVVRDGWNGYQFEGKDDFQEHLREFMDNPSQGQKMGSNAASFVREEYSIDHFAASVLQIYTNCLDQNQTAN